jgi:hypothetical protein
MKKMNLLSAEFADARCRERSLLWFVPGRVAFGFVVLAMVVLAFAFPPTANASENVPYRPFAYLADLPEPRQFIGGFVYQESEAYNIWASGVSHNITTHTGGESYGIDINQGFIALQYGIKDRWAADANVGATTAGWRTFDHGAVQSTTGLMDFSFGVRYAIFREYETTSAWLPTLTFRAGAVLPGTFNENFPFAPGLRSAAIEPEFLARKHFGWPGLGAYFDGLYRWNRTTGNDQYIVAIGLFQQIKGWELDVGYRHLQTLSGGDIILNPDNTIVYPRDTREIRNAIEAGFSYTTPKRHIRYGFQCETIFDGNNTDRKFWVGGSIDIPFGGKHKDDSGS